MYHRWMFDSPIFVYGRKHFCPQCTAQLVRTRANKIIHSGSPEAKKYDFDSVDTYMTGNVKFTWTEFKCPHCGFQIQISDLIKHEREQRRKRKLMRKNGVR